MGTALRILIGALCGVLPLGTAQAQSDYPSRPIRFIVPHTPGGLGDTFSRYLADQISPRLGQPIVVDNRPGASQAIGAEIAAKSPADGYTIFLGTQEGLVFNSFTRKTLPYDAVNDFTPISMLFSTPQYLIVHPSVQANSVQELVTLMRSKPGKLSYASLGSASSHHLAAAIFMSRMNIDILHVPYKGSPAAMLDVLSGRVDMIFQGGGSGLPPVRAGKLRLLASTGLKRSAATPDTPTMHESGMPGFEVDSWFGLVGPAGTPRPVVERLNREVVAVLRSSVTSDKFVVNGVEILPSTPEELGARIRADLPVWNKILQDAGVQAE
jgi:tripartite-type tricarboxylate transporter receptor subunit TctC